MRHFSSETGTHKDWLCERGTISRNGTGRDVSGANFCNDLNRVDQRYGAVMAELNDEVDSDTVIIALGFSSRGFSESFIRSETVMLLSHLKRGQKCYWIAPTATTSEHDARMEKVLRGLRAGIRESKFPCELIETRSEMSRQTSCTSFNSSDGLYPSDCGSSLWADTVIDKICR